MDRRVAVGPFVRHLFLKAFQATESRGGAAPCLAEAAAPWQLATLRTYRQQLPGPSERVLHRCSEPALTDAVWKRYSGRSHCVFQQSPKYFQVPGASGDSWRLRLPIPARFMQQARVALRQTSLSRRCRPGGLVCAIQQLLATSERASLLASAIHTGRDANACLEGRG